MTLLERFLQYVKIDTQSDEASPTSPSTAKQLVLLRLLVDQLKELDLVNVRLSDTGTVYGELPGNGGPAHPVIGFIAHVDTALEMPGGPVKPRIINNYDGQSIILNKELGITLPIEEFPHMKQFVGKTLVVTDGTTLLGADDKAGIAIIMDLFAHLKKHPEIIHGPLRVAFTPDEEIGRGVEHFDVEGFGADIGYTLDGGDLHYLNYENFNASTALLKFHGSSIHPGSAKGKMINAQLVAVEFFNLLPPNMLPHLTENYEGFHHLVHSSGSVEGAEAQYILRNHDEAILTKQEQNFIDAAATLNKKYQREVVSLLIKPGYRNMRPLIEKHPEVLDRALNAYKKLGIETKIVPIRGGTDGANLTYKGIPCPNLANGGYHFHGKYELVIVEQMYRMVDVLLEIIK
jgi:tripeptide aminopeptidase